MMKKFQHNSGFTMIELVVSIVVIGILAMYALNTESQKTKKEQFNAMYEITALTVDQAIYSSTNGYASDKGGTCSTNYDVVNISAARIKDCTGISSELVRGADDLDGADSYFVFLKTYGDGSGCHVYYNDEAAFATAIFLDCSSLDGTDPGLAEQGFVSYMREKNPLGLKNFYPEATDINTNTGGTSSDGMVKIVVEE